MNGVRMREIVSALPGTVIPSEALFFVERGISITTAPTLISPRGQECLRHTRGRLYPPKESFKVENSKTGEAFWPFCTIHVLWPSKAQAERKMTA
jgi:hypothetical protein